MRGLGLQDQRRHDFFELDNTISLLFLCLTRLRTAHTHLPVTFLSFASFQIEQKWGSLGRSIGKYVVVWLEVE